MFISKKTFVKHCNGEGEIKMFKYGKRSIEVRATIHPDLQKIFDEVLKKIDHAQVCGFRGEKDQNEAYDKGFSQVRFPHGNHNKYPSTAVDAYPYPITDLNSKNQRERELYKQRMCYFAGWVMDIAARLFEEGKVSHKLKWGADWDSDTELKDHNFLDYPHFELIM
jgi:peptidoglycan L-alanyl-D-glutamate endopeptidase CwlK